MSPDPESTEQPARALIDRRSVLRRGVLAGVGLSAAALIGCGGDDDANTARTTSQDSAAACTPAARQQVPQELLGTWETSVPRKEIEDMPNEYIGASRRWTITISESGGVDDGPSFTYANEKLGALESFSAFEVADGKIAFFGICEGYEEPQTYSYALEGNELTLEVAESPCPDVAYLESLFTTNPFRKVD